MPAALDSTTTQSIPAHRLQSNPFSISIYGNPSDETGDLLDSIRSQGILVPIVVAPDGPDAWEVLSGHRRLACARVLDLPDVPCLVRELPQGAARRRAVLEYNRQRRKTFSQLMREADALESLLSADALRRRRANLLHDPKNPPDRRNSDDRSGRTDVAIARALGLGGKDLYRQARALWRSALDGDPRALGGVAQIDAGSKSIHAAYKDLRRRDRFTSGFRPTPYDVWSFRHDPAFGTPHPGSIPASIVAHALHYFTAPGALVVDPMAGGGTTLDVCESMGRRCLAYDLHPTRPQILPHDIRDGFPDDAIGCDLIFCDPPYHTMLAGRYAGSGIGDIPLTGWIAFLQRFAEFAIRTLKPSGHIALLLANQSEKDLPAGYGYIDHGFHGYQALMSVGFLPVRRISCPMSGAYLPQQVRRARDDGRLLGQVRDLLVMRKPADHNPSGSPPASS